MVDTLIQGRDTSVVLSARQSLKNTLNYDL